jgi:glycosyltransferase involved in cell wall biosynthesis
VRVLIEALRLLRGEAQTDVRVAVVGAGPLESACRDAAAESDARVRLELLAPVPYGEAFFSLLRRFHALLVPNLADEQPRIVFDAYSQALPVLGSATAGLAGCVRDGVTGRLFAPADPQALARTVREAATDPTALERLGLAALAVARSMTHQEMHRQRHVLIADALRARALA